MTNSEKMIRTLQSRTAKRGQILALLEADLYELKLDSRIIRVNGMRAGEAMRFMKRSMHQQVRAMAFEQKVDRIALKAIHASRR